MRAIRGVDRNDWRLECSVVASFLEVKKMHSCSREQLNNIASFPGPNPAFRCLQYKKWGNLVHLIIRGRIESNYLIMCGCTYHTHIASRNQQSYTACVNCVLGLSNACGSPV